MSNIGSVSSYVSSLVSPPQTHYDVNNAAYGPVVAGVVGVAEAAADSVSAVVSFSAESLGKLGDVAESGLHSVSDVFGDVADAVGDAVDSAENSVVSLYNEVAGMAEDTFDAVGDAASSLADGISSAAGTVASYVAMGVEAGKQTVSEIL
ncbi:hypothetical protein [Rhodoferax saidenbachensis]|uniref:Uncharacterized protein n=1 Tax=Rhodoferax saidenbachensis TaxID=1484693 RepID=A0A1P8KBE1_9BURK|nr:hypothetical protein [Rhodoferax saidenbachensis]APW43266.1 hypothetical protein RS694_12515 [Rhodoferax saidenbachensis]